MLSSQTVVPILIEIACGVAGGIFLGWLFRGLSQGLAGDAVVGGIGGVVFTWLAGFVPGVARFVGKVESVADATMQSTGGLTPPVLVGVGIAGLVGGLLFTA
jgi:hypothetical protein